MVIAPGGRLVDVRIQCTSHGAELSNLSQLVANNSVSAIIVCWMNQLTHLPPFILVKNSLAFYLFRGISAFLAGQLWRTLSHAVLWSCYAPAVFTPFQPYFVLFCLLTASALTVGQEESQQRAGVFFFFKTTPSYQNSLNSLKLKVKYTCNLYE